MTSDAHPLAGLAPEARVRLEVFWEIVKRMNPVTPADWDAARQQALLTESMILDGASSRSAEPAKKRPAWAPVDPEIAAVVERMAKAGAPTRDIRRATGLPDSTVRGLIRRNEWKPLGVQVATPPTRTATAPTSLPPPQPEPRDEFIERPPLPSRAAEPPVAAPAPAPLPTAQLLDAPRPATGNPFADNPVGGGKPKLSADDLVVIRRRVEAGERQADVATDYGVSEAAIYARARTGGWSVPSRRKTPAPPVSRETPPATPQPGLSGNGIATKNKIRAAAITAGIAVDRAPTMQTVDAAAVLRGRGHRVTRLPLEGKWRVDDREPMTLPELERMARQVAP